jgi:hypothetical protein
LFGIRSEAATVLAGPFEIGFAIVASRDLVVGKSLLTGLALDAEHSIFSSTYFLLDNTISNAFLPDRASS